MERAQKRSSKPNMHILEGRYFEPANDVGQLIEVNIFKLMLCAFAIAMVTLVFGGAVIFGLIIAVAAFFEAPAFAELKYMGFSMSGILGAIFALWFLFYKSLGNRYAEFRLTK